MGGSPQDLFFCSPDDKRTCTAGWGLRSALRQLELRQLQRLECLPYQPRIRADDVGDNCASKCLGEAGTNPTVTAGSFTVEPIETMWEAQQHIRRFGAVVTSFDLMTDFKDFFDNFANKVG
jgi:hypothetical protein